MTTRQNHESGNTLVSSHYNETYDYDDNFVEALSANSFKKSENSTVTPFKTDTQNDTIWGETKESTLQMSKPTSGLTKITINTAGGDPKMEQDLVFVQQKSVGVEQSYNDNNQNTTNVVIKRVGGDEIKVNQGQKKVSSRVEVLPGIRVPEGQVNVANVLKTSLSDSNNSSRAVEMFNTRKIRSARFQKVSYGTNNEEELEYDYYGSEDDLEAVSKNKNGTYSQKIR